VIDLEERDDGVVLVRWRDGENRYHPASVARWHEVLDDLEGRDGPLALVVTGEGKFFSNGLDLDGFATDPSSAGIVVDGVHRLFGRMAVFPAYTVAALNGHVFAGGAMLACTFDARVMRADRGYWCLPEVDLGVPVTPEMFATVTARLSTAAAADALVTGRRYTAAEAQALGIVEQVAAEDEVVARALEMAAPMAAKNRTIIAAHKWQLFGHVAELCGVARPAD
jgi:enoyl-CoA hydratase/carnithine racemase